MIPVEGNVSLPLAEGLKLNELKGFFQAKVFYDPVILWSLSYVIMKSKSEIFDF